MANQFGSISSQAGILKTVFQGPIVDQFNEEVNIYRGAAKGQFNWQGQQVNRPVKVRRNPGIGAASDGGNLPKIGKQTTVQAVILAKYNYLRFGLTGPLIAASKNDTGSFVRGAAFELTEGYNDLKSDANRQMTWDGSGDVALANAATAASTSLVIKGREATEPALKFIDVDWVFDIYTSAGVLVQSSITVTSISAGTPSSATATLVCDQAVTCSAGDVLVRSGSFNQEIQGILTQLDGATSTVFGLDRSSYQQLTGNVIDNGAAAMSLDVLQRLMDETERRGGKGINAIYSDYTSRRMYNKLLVADKRYVNSVKGDGGFSNKNQSYLEFNGIPWVADKDCPTRVFMLPDEYIEKYVLAEMAFADDTGSMYIAQTENDQLEVRVRFFANLFNSKASGAGALSNYISP